MQCPFCNTLIVGLPRSTLAVQFIPGSILPSVARIYGCTTCWAQIEVTVKALNEPQRSEWEKLKSEAPPAGTYCARCGSKILLSEALKNPLCKDCQEAKP